MKVQFTFLENSEKISQPAATNRWIEEIIEAEGKKAGEISFVITSDNHLLEINRKFLNHDYFTDVISFGDQMKNRISGDVFISEQRVRENAITYGKTYQEELLRVIVHGLLHLIGYEDDSEKKKQEMTRLEDKYINIALRRYRL